MGRVSSYKNDEGLKSFHDSFECMCCGKKIKEGGIYWGFNNLGLCSICSCKDPKDMGLSAIGYTLADAYLDSPVRDKKTPLEFVKPILAELEKIMYYSISHGMDWEIKKNKKVS